MVGIGLTVSREQEKKYLLAIKHKTQNESERRAFPTNGHGEEYVIKR